MAKAPGEAFGEPVAFEHFRDQIDEGPRLRWQESARRIVK